jgi:hypothetical protein
LLRTPIGMAVAVSGPEGKTVSSIGCLASVDQGSPRAYPDALIS